MLCRLISISSLIRKASSYVGRSKSVGKNAGYMKWSKMVILWKCALTIIGEWRRCAGVSSNRHRIIVWKSWCWWIHWMRFKEPKIIVSSKRRSSGNGSCFRPIGHGWCAIDKRCSSNRYWQFQGNGSLFDFFFIDFIGGRLQLQNSSQMLSR